MEKFQSSIIRKLCLVLCLCLMLQFVPTTAFAAPIAARDAASVSCTVDIAGLTYTFTPVKATDVYGVEVTDKVYSVEVRNCQRKGNEITFFIDVDFTNSHGNSGYVNSFASFTDSDCAKNLNQTISIQQANGDSFDAAEIRITRSAGSHAGNECVKKKCSRCNSNYDAPCDYSALETRILEDGSGEHRYVCSKNASHTKDWEKCYHPDQCCYWKTVCKTCGQRFLGADFHDFQKFNRVDPRTGETMRVEYTTNGISDEYVPRTHRRSCRGCSTTKVFEHNFDQQATCIDMAVCESCFYWYYGDHEKYLIPHPEKPLEEHAEYCRHCEEYFYFDSDQAKHVWENGSCTVCEFVCDHAWENGVCTLCATFCSHSYDHYTYKCTVCGLDCAHNFDSGICTDCGYYCEHDWDHNKMQYYSVCNYCGLLCGHSYHESYRIEATCSAQGVIGYKCAFCTSVKNEVLEALEHDYTWTYTDTTHEGYCSVGKETKTGFHNYSRDYFDPTCTEDGYYTDTCTDCGYTRKTTTSPKLNHYGGEATCKAPAVCERCGEGYGEPGSHKGGEATCTDLAICEVCGEGYGQLKGHESELDDYDCTTPVRCSVCGTVTKEANKVHTWDENNFCSNENCQETKGFTFTFTYGDEVLFVRNVHTGNFYTFEDFEERDGLTLVGWDADDDGEVDYAIDDYIYVDGDLSFKAVYKLVYTVRFITYDIWEGVYTESFNPIMGEANQTVTLWDDASSYYKFLGWATEEGGKVVYEANEQITLTKNLTLYGVIRPYQATFDIGEGAVWNDEKGEPITVLEGDYSSSWIEIRKFPVRTGYIFKGFVDQTEWFWEPWQDEDTGEWVVDFYFDRADLQMTAVWEECTGHTFVDGKCSLCGTEIHTHAPGADGSCGGCGQVFVTMKALPETVEAAVAEKITVTVEATGENLTYQWYYANPGKDTFTLTTSYTGAEYSLVMSEVRNGRRIYCVVTDENGFFARTNTVTLTVPRTELAIVKQPEDVTVSSGEKAAVTFEAVGDGLSYAWYYANPGKDTFTKTDAFTSNSYSVTMSESRSGRRIYCIVTDKYGQTLQTNTVTLTMQAADPVVIVSQSKSVWVPEGEKAVVTVNAEGDGLTYKWYYKNPGATKYTYTDSFKGDTYSVTMNAERSGRYVYCKVTDAYGNTVKSKTVSVNMQTPLEIVTQPKSVRVDEGATAKVTVKAQGDGLTYKWYYKNPGASKYSYTDSFTGSSYSITMNESRDGRYVYCKVYDKYGNMVKTDTVSLRMK